jgi:hypothetical protein
MSRERFDDNGFRSQHNGLANARFAKSPKTRHLAGGELFFSVLVCPFSVSSPSGPSFPGSPFLSTNVWESNKSDISSDTDGLA